MEIKFNIEKRHFWIITSILVLGLSAIFGVATWEPTKTVWHSADDVKVVIDGVDYSIQESVATLSADVSQLQTTIGTFDNTISCGDCTCWSIMSTPPETITTSQDCWLNRITHSLCTPDGWKKTGVTDSGIECINA